MKEVWRTVPDFPRFQASMLGRIKRVAFVSARGHNLPEKIVKPTSAFHVNVAAAKSCSVGSLVLRAFVRIPLPGEVARHLDDNKAHNLLPNLAWGTRKDNAEDAVRNKRIGRGSPAAAKTSIKLQGHKHADITKKRIGDALRGKKHTPEACARMSLGHLGKPLSQATRDKMSKVHKGRRLSEESKAKISQAHKGRVHTPEARFNMSQGWKRKRSHGN